MANDFKQEIQQAEQAIETIILSLKKLDTQITSVSNNAAQNLGKVSQALSPNDMNSKLKTQQQLIDNVNTEIKEQKNLTEQLTTAKQKQRNITSEEIVGQRQLKKNADLQAQATMKLVGTYQNLIAKQRQARTTLRNLISSNRSNTKEIKKAQIQYDRLTRKVNRANKVTSNFSKTGLGGMVRGFRNLIGAFGVIAGAQLFATMIKSVFDLTRTLNSMSFAMKAVIKDTFELRETEKFLTEITNNFGAELVTTTNRYIKFRAAAIQANFTAKETQDIFGTMTKAAGVLGLKTDELTGIFLALEQMISKGKITTEELRRQLGERLPGAMDIMAKSLGVNTAKLDGMLKKGQVITKDVLPAFARQVEKAFGIENVERVETLQAAVIRLGNSWTTLIKDIEGSEGGLSSLFIPAIEGAEELILRLNDINTLLTSQLSLRDRLLGVVLSISDPEALREAAEMLRVEKERNLLLQEVDKILDSVNEKEDGRFINEKQRNIIRGLSNEQLVTWIKSMKAALEVIEDVTDSERKRVEFLEGTIARIKQIIELNRERIILELGADDPERKRLIEVNKELEKQIDWLLKIDKLKGGSDPASEDDFIPGLTPTLIKLARAKTLGEELLTVFEGLTDSFSDVFDIDMSKFEFLLDENINSVEEWTDASKELIGSVLDASLRRYELEFIEAQRTRDLILNNDLASDEEKENARKRFDAKERQIKLERAKKERENTLIQIAVDTAAAIVKVTAQTGVLAPGIIPAIIAIGLAQASIVASQPLPKFADGGEMKKDGWALTQEKRAEPITDMYGRLKTMGSDSGAMLTPLQKGDEVHKSREDFFRKNSGKAINKAVWNMNMASNGEELSKRFVDNSLLNEMKGLRKDNIDMNKKIMRLGSRPINVHNTVEIKDERPY